MELSSLFSSISIKLSRGSPTRLSTATTATHKLPPKQVLLVDPLDLIYTDKKRVPIQQPPKKQSIKDTICELCPNKGPFDGGFGFMVTLAEHIKYFYVSFTVRAKRLNYISILQEKAGLSDADKLAHSSKLYSKKLKSQRVEKQKLNLFTYLFI